MSRPSGLEVDDEVKLGRPRHRQIAWLGRFENPAGVNAGLRVSVGHIGSVANESAGGRELALNVNRRHCMASFDGMGHILTSQRDKMVIANFGNILPGIEPDAAWPKS